MIPNKQELEELYLDRKMSISSIARHYKSHNPTVRKWLDLYDISRRTHKESCLFHIEQNKKSIPSKEELLELYKTKNLKQLQMIYNVGQETIYQWFKNLDIELRSSSESICLNKSTFFADKQIPKEVIVEEFTKIKNLPILADKLNISYSHLKVLLKRYNLKFNSCRSKNEQELFDLINDGSFMCNDRSIIYPLELDMYSEKHKLALEYCGLYWHSEFFGGKSKSYHQIKQQRCAELGIRLITVFETDDITKIKCLVNRLTNKVPSVYGRNTNIVTIDSKTAKTFHELHHLSGSVPGSIHYGLEHDGKLAMVLSFSKSRFNKKFDYECTRMTSHSNLKVIGGASKLFNEFFKHHKSCITYADLRFGDGSVYEHCGFTKNQPTPPNYWYFNKNRPNQLYSRVKFQKHKLKSILELYDESLTEFELMKLNGFDRIWDCGSNSYCRTI